MGNLARGKSRCLLLWTLVNLEPKFAAGGAAGAAGALLKSEVNSVSIYPPTWRQQEEQSRFTNDHSTQATSRWSTGPARQRSSGGLSLRIKLRGGSDQVPGDSGAAPGEGDRQDGAERISNCNDEAVGWLDRDESLAAMGSASAFQLVLRGCFLALVFMFPVLTAGLAYLSTWFRDQVWFDALTRSIAVGGTAFIKWGQWSSTRPDMFSEGLCKSLSVLHKGAPCHKYPHTKKLVERAYGGRPINEVFDWFDEKPMASGSIAQVHKAVLNGQVVAVKVRHPKVKERIFMDFVIMKKIATFADSTPSLKWMNLGPSMEQFSHTMAAQTNLTLEATHLNIFNDNFGGKAWEDCGFPRVIHAVEDVLVETFEEGYAVSDYVKMFSPEPLNGNHGMWDWGIKFFNGRGRKDGDRDGDKALGRPDPRLGHFIVTRGEDMWLKMVLTDGLLHADLHPGNILIHAPQDGVSPLRLVLVDAGMVARLYGHQRRHFIRLLECLGSGNGIGAGQAVLNFSATQTCVGHEAQEAFFRDMDTLFRDRCRGYNTNVDVGDILRGVLSCVRRHSVRIDMEYATLILNILCLDSMAKVLLPTYSVLDGAKTLLESHRIGKGLVGGVGARAFLPVARVVKRRQDRKFIHDLMRDLDSTTNHPRKATLEQASEESSKLSTEDEVDDVSSSDDGTFVS